MFEAIIDHLWQSTLIVLVAWAATIALRRHGAHLRYWIWFAASMKFLIPFALIAQLGAQIPWPESLPVTAQTEWPALATRILKPTTTFDRAPSDGEAGVASLSSEQAAAAPTLAGQILGPAVSPTSAASEAPVEPTISSREPNRAPLSLAAIAFAIWAAGSALLILRWGRGWVALRGMLRQSAPVPVDDLERGLPEVRACSSVMEPGIFGIFKPVLLIPEGLLRRLTRDQLRAIVRHERVHVERHDNLTAALHMLVEAVFWFHPFVWWIGARMIDERERACDEAVLASGVDPDVYASGLIEVCDFYMQSPLICAAGVGGGSLRMRVRRIADNVRLPKLGRLGRASLAAAPAVFFLVPLGIGLLEVQAARAQQAAAAQYGELLECVNPDVLASLVLRGAPSVISGAMPDDMAGITPPAEFTWIGSRTADMTGQGLVGLRSTASATYKTDLSREAAIEAAGSRLMAAGWEKAQRESPGGGAFATTMPEQPDAYCMDERAVNVNANEIDGTTYVSYGFTRGQASSLCQPESLRGMMPGVEYMPTLDFPPDPVTGLPVRPGASGSSGSQSRVEIRHNATLGDLTTALTQQLVEQGWANDASWVGTTTAGSSWSKRADDGTRVQGTLDLTDTGETTYTVMFRLLVLQ